MITKNMAIPVIFAETLAITELIVLFTRNLTGIAKKIISSLLVSTYQELFLYLALPFLSLVSLVKEKMTWVS